MALRRYPVPMRVLLRALAIFKFNSLIPVYIYLSDMFLLLANRLIMRANGGTHPKHRIMNYGGWFASKVQTTDSVLDIGSSTGELSFALASKAKEVVGVEINPVTHEYAKKFRPKENLTYILADITKTDLGRKFDAVVMSNVLEHIADRKTILEAVGRISPKLLVRVPCKDRDWWTYYREENGILWVMDETHYVEYTEESLRKEMLDAGWKIVSMERRWSEFYIQCNR